MSDIASPGPALPVGPRARTSVGWWGVLCLIATEAGLFAYLLFSYFYLAIVLDDTWLPSLPRFRFALPGIILLILSSGTMACSSRAAQRGARRWLLAGTLATLLLGLGFFALQLADWETGSLTLRSGAYGSIYFVITGVHLAHVTAGIVALVLVMIWSTLGYFDMRCHTPVLVVAAYWHFVVAAGVAVFLALYVTPYLG